MSKKEKIVKSDQSFWAYVKRQFRKKRTAVISMYIATFIGLVALLAPFLANEKPLVCKYEGKVYFPVFREFAVGLGIADFPHEFSNKKWSELHYDFVVFPPVPYSPLNQDPKNVHSVGPFAEQDVPSRQFKHWFGTDELGRDVLSGLIHGARIAFTVGIVSMTIASLLGILLGALAGYFGDENLKISRIRFFINVLFFFFAFFFAFQARSYALADAMEASIPSALWQLLISLLIFIGIMGIGNLLVIPFKYIPMFKKEVSVPVDIIISRMIEILNSIPTLFLILSILAIIKKPNIYYIMVIIGLTGWTSIARYIRAELLRIRNLEYIEASHSLGFSGMRILFRHALPNALSSTLIAIAFGIASAILTESSLSFLGFGSGDTVTWGVLLSSARQSPQAWWLAIFPGFAIFITVTVFNLIGDGLTDALDPRLKQ
ncbi:MAG: transporter permease [Bacteroidetes bacterium]|nr:transporter permease [Bacteroidota bacterium]